MLAGMRCRINTRTFQNDFFCLRSKDDVLTLLVHLGYLAYDAEKKEVYIPNQEVADEQRSGIQWLAGSFRRAAGISFYWAVRVPS